MAGFRFPVFGDEPERALEHRDAGAGLRRLLAEQLPEGAPAGLGMEQSEQVPADVLERDAARELRLDVGQVGAQQARARARRPPESAQSSRCRR
jgi:hypothetical protein